ncbi:MAG: hypothetical protein GX556_13910 [Fibrobacter sp.]|nr:hypothetical protein [Fibrobacter sp.]
MNSRYLFCVIFLIGSIVNAQTDNSINVRGKVTSGSKVISGAFVTLMGENIKDTTDINGDYSITKSSVAVIKSAAPQNERITFRNGILELSLLKSSPVKIEVFNVKGKLLRKEVLRNTNAGVYRINFAGISRASEVLLIRASIGGNTMSCRYLPLQNGKSVSGESAGIFQSQFGGGLAKLTAVVDSLKVEKEGFTSKVVLIESYDEIVNISLDSVNADGGFKENQGSNCAVGTIPGTINSNKLPDPFTKFDGTRMSTKSEWPCRRQEIWKLAEKYMYGEKPMNPESVTGTVTGSKITVNVSNGGKSVTFSVEVSLPSGGSGPYPAIIGLGGGFMGFPLDEAAVKGEGVATILYDPYKIGSESTSRTNKTGVFYDLYGNRSKTGLLMAWAWGVSRIIDVIEQSGGDLIRADAIGVSGCSRFGKGAFAIGVFDQRIALTIPFESGSGGVPIYRGLSGEGAQSASSAYGETYWLGDDFQPFTNNTNALPLDAHELVAMVAPRGLLILDNPHIANLGPKSAHVSALGGAEVYKALGVGGNIAYISNVTDGSHCRWRTEFATPLKNSIARHLKKSDNAPDGVINAHSKATGKLSDWITWTTPALE